MSVSIEVEIELECDECGAELKGSVTKSGTIAVRPCEDCKED